MLAALLLALATAHFEPVTPMTTAQTEQVFVRDASVRSQPFGDGTGHDTGLRPPRETDSGLAPLFTARGDAINVSLGDWRLATGDVQLEPAADGGTRVRATFSHLLPRGRYSLFVRQLAGRTGAVLLPVDLTGAQNSFFADPSGNGTLVVASPNPIAPGAQLVLVFHSDGRDYGSSVGNPGVNAHAQLITRVP